MDQDKEIQRLFYEALNQPRKKRLEWLAAECSDQDLRREVEALLARDPGTGKFLEPPTMPSAPSPEDIEDFEVEGFEIQRVLGTGATATVFLARDKSLNRDVALKIVTPPPLDAGAQLARFKQGAEIQAGLNHPRIVPIYQVGEAQGRHFLAMGYVPGETLADRLQQDRAKKMGSGERVERDRELALMLADMAEALDHAHRAKVIHRDVKPSNIIIDAKGQTHLIDFGIAKDGTHEDLTEEGSLLGTLRYMSPEQAKGATKIKLDARSDVFSLGVVLYESISLRQPFTGDTVQEILSKVITKDATPIGRIHASIAADLAIIIQKAMEKDPAHRYQSAMHMAADLRAFVSGTPILAKPPSIGRRLKRGIGRYVYLIAGSMLLASGVGFGLLADGSERSYSGHLSMDVGSAVGFQVKVYSIELTDSGEVISDRDEESPTNEESERLIATLHQVEVRGSLVFSDEYSQGQHVQAKLSPGVYTVDVVGEDASFNDVVIVVQNESDLHLVMNLKGAKEVPAGMIEFNSTEWVEAFYLDSCEVSNADYAKFLSGLSGEEREELTPIWWGLPSDGTHWENLPVVGITWDAATRYAAWCGKRLPTDTEWTIAYADQNVRAFPWGDAPPEDPAISAQMGFGPYTPVTKSTLRGQLIVALQEYLGSARAVDDPGESGAAPQDLSQEGVINLHRNVMEWTSSIPTLGHYLESQRLLDRKVKGLAWYSMPYQTAGGRTHFTQEAHVGQFGLGFRCARTVSH